MSNDKPSQYNIAVTGTGHTVSKITYCLRKQSEMPNDAVIFEDI